MYGNGGDNGGVGYTTTHPKADAVAGYHLPRAGVAKQLFVSALAGAALGGLIAILFNPPLMPALALGMAMTFTGIRTAMYVRSRKTAFAQKNEEQQARRDRFEQQHAEAKAKGELDRWNTKE